MTRTRLAAFMLSVGLLLITGISPVAAATAFNLTTPYPAVTVQPGNTVTFDLDVSVPTPERVGLAVSGTPIGLDRQRPGRRQHRQRGLCRRVDGCLDRAVGVGPPVGHARGVHDHGHGQLGPGNADGCRSR